MLVKNKLIKICVADGIARQILIWRSVLRRAVTISGALGDYNE